MRKMIVILLALVLVSSAFSQVRVLNNKEIFATEVCTLGGINTDFVNNPYNSGDSCFAWSLPIKTTIPVYGPAGFSYEVPATRIFMEVTYSDSTPVNNSLSLNDTLLCYVYPVGPDGKANGAAVDTLVFAMTGAKLGVPVCHEISPFNYPGFDMSGTKLRYHAKDFSGLGSGDSLGVITDHMPIEIMLKLAADCSTASMTPATPWAVAYDDTLMVKSRLIMEYCPSGVPGW